MLRQQQHQTALRRAAAAQRFLPVAKEIEETEEEILKLKNAAKVVTRRERLSNRRLKCFEAQGGLSLCLEEEANPTLTKAAIWKASS
jgi:hypothetical protein